uniref:hypothetical protein n=1 Tax=Segatella hominis TaxID=2518605 RepID=UPI004024E130
MPKNDRSNTKCMLDAYFVFRSNLPKTDADGQPYQKRFKTTEEIASELATMVAIDYSEIVDYMRERDYVVATLPDGSIAWAIWERVQGIL